MKIPHFCALLLREPCALNIPGGGGEKFVPKVLLAIFHELENVAPLEGEEGRDVRQLDKQLGDEVQRVEHVRRALTLGRDVHASFGHL